MTTVVLSVAGSYVLAYFASRGIVALLDALGLVYRAPKPEPPERFTRLVVPPFVPRRTP